MDLLLERVTLFFVAKLNFSFIETIRIYPPCQCFRFLQVAFGYFVVLRKISSRLKVIDSINSYPIKFTTNESHISFSIHSFSLGHTKWINFKLFKLNQVKILAFEKLASNTNSAFKNRKPKIMFNSTLEFRFCVKSNCMKMEMTSPNLIFRDISGSELEIQESGNP